MEEKEEILCPAQSSVYSERQIHLIVEVETPLPKVTRAEPRMHRKEEDRASVL
jgi:hypothetical protein